jgi:hypothetical protein
MMSRSGSYDFTLTRDELIKASFRLIGVGHRGESVPADEINDASEALNIMIKAWQADGLQLWKREDASITLSDGVSTYTLGPTGSIVMQRPLRILECVRRDTSNIDVPLNKLSKQEYTTLSNKFNAGTPVSYHYDPQLDNGEFTIWQTPDADIAAEYTIEIVYHIPFEDMDSTTDNFDFPVEWLEAIKYGLAIRLAPEYGIDLPSQYRLDKVMYGDPAKGVLGVYDKALSWDQENTSIYFQPDHRVQR